MSLIAKLAEVMKAVERVPKRGRNDFHKYDYATEADIVATVRVELANRQVMLLPGVSSISREPVGEKGSVLTTAAMTFTFWDGETGETIERPWFGCGTDKEDKGLYKAMTGGEKYFLLKTFLMPTGDDPEAAQPETSGKRQKATPEPTPAKSDMPVRPSRPVTDADRTAAKALGAVLVMEVKDAFAPVLAELCTSDGETLPLFRGTDVEVAKQACYDVAPVEIVTKLGKKTNKPYVSTIKRAVSDADLDAEIAKRELALAGSAVA